MWYLGGKLGNFLNVELIQHDTVVKQKRKNKNLSTQIFHNIQKII